MSWQASKGKARKSPYPTITIMKDRIVLSRFLSAYAMRRKTRPNRTNSEGKKNAKKKQARDMILHTISRPMRYLDRHQTPEKNSK